MATPVKDEDNYDRDGVDSVVTDTSAAEAALKARLSRKRTKTGCLTCRKRRIKCGEERPICRNCVKSKRHCEGYNQRVVFKQPTIDFRHLQNGAASITFQAGAMGMDFDALPPGAQYVDANGSIYALQPHPRPLLPYDPRESHSQPMFHHQYQPLGPGMPQAGAPGELMMMQAPPYAPSGPYHGLQHTQQPVAGTSAGVPTSSQPGIAQMLAPGMAYEQAPSKQLYMHQHLSDVAVHQQQATPFQQHHFMPPPQTPLAQSQVQLPASQVALSGPDAASTHYATLYKAQSFTGDEPSTAPGVTASQTSWQIDSYVPRPELVRPIDSAPTTSRSRQPSYARSQYSEPIKNQASSLPLNMSLGRVQLSGPGPTRLLNEAAIEVQDDDYYDVHSEDDLDMAMETAAVASERQQERVNAMRAMSQLSLVGSGPRTYNGFVNGGMLDAYRPEWVANPLKNPMTARVFAHFISATGPTLSTFTRRSRNPQDSIGSSHLPLQQQGIWTYSMPMAAMHHQSLLQAILALSSLHIAKLTGASTTPSIKHYAYALKRIHHSLGHPFKRHSVPVLAASLLLGIYELWCADHVKWNSHLAGAKQLVVETDYKGMHRQLRKLKADQALRRHNYFSQQYQPDSMHPVAYLNHPQDALLNQVYEIDPQIVGSFAGKEVNYDDFGRIVNEHETDASCSDPSELDISRFEILKDLFWLYCKSDTFNSLVSGNPLLLTFGRFTDCPPRAPIGRADAVYGSFDHLMLLLGRLADFTVKDRRRKIKVMENNGGQWRPAPSMVLGPSPGPIAGQGPGVPGARTHKSQQPSAAGPPQLPAFYGMAPSSSQTGMPSSYQTSHDESTPGTPHVYDPIDISAATTAAIEEWNQIRGALSVFESMLGDNFQPLSAEYQQPLQSPFGPALFYRSYDIACLWGQYNMALIIATRCHPHMPPHAHVAAAVAAYQTRNYADEIGRIGCGIIPPPANEPLNPTLGAAFTETCVPLFFAAIQYQHPAQREWTVTRLFEIERRCGYDTASLIANGIQTAWWKASQNGRGPPYVRRWNTQAQDERISGAWEYKDTQVPVHDAQLEDRRFSHTKAQARLHFAIGIIGTEEDN